MNFETEIATHSMLRTLNPMNNQYDGMYRGTVVNNDDPEHRGRCKIFIRGVYNDDFEDDNGQYLPWAEPSQPLFCGGIEKNGTFQCPDMGSTVWCFFESGDTTRPVFFGQTTDAQGYFDTDHCKLYWDGMYIEFEKSTHTITASAMYIKGTASKDMFGHADNDGIFDCGNNATVSVGNNASLSVGNNASLSVGNNASVNVGSATSLNSGSSIDVIAGSAVNVTAPDVIINGNVTINGTTHITGATTCDADASIGGKSFLTHTHLGTPLFPTTPPI